MKGLEELMEDEENSELFTEALIFLSKNNQSYFDAVIKKLNDIKDILILSLGKDIDSKKKEFQFKYSLNYLTTSTLFTLISFSISHFYPIFNSFTLFFLVFHLMSLFYFIGKNK